MKDLSPKRISFFISLICSLVFLTLFYFFSNYAVLKNWFIAIIGFVLVFILLNRIILKIIQRFIIDKITPIYKTIHNINISESDSKENKPKDIITTAEKDVIDWAKDRRQEITHLKQMEKYRKEYLGNVSHELKTPIFNIQGYILTLLDGGIDDSNVNRMYLERAEKSINRLISIVDDLGIISSLESGELKLDTTRFNIVQLVEEVFETQEIRAKEYNVTLKHTHSSYKPVFVEADREKIYQALNNLVLNSINYGKKNGITTISFTDMGENIMIEIADNGIGIAKQDIPRLFERFYRVDRSRSRNLGGTGLGLAIVKHIIEAHKQTVNVYSKPKKGSTFSFTLQKA